MHHVRLLLESVGDLPSRPTRQGTGLDDHQPMGNLRQNRAGSETLDLLPLDSLHEPIADGAKDRMRLKVIDENIRIDENPRARRDLIEHHGPSSGSNSGCSAKYSACSAVPLNPMIPY